jgi:predicted histidine transporter YuiF (NhaC family)
MLVERFGHVTAYWIMAGGLAIVGVLAAIVVSVKEHEEQVAEDKAQQADTQEVVSDAAAQAIVQAPVALLGALFTTPGGATSAFKVARLLGRNLPLVVLLVMIGALFWPAPDAEGEEAQIGDGVGRANGLGSADVYH